VKRMASDKESVTNDCRFCRGKGTDPNFSYTASSGGKTKPCPVCGGIGFNSPRYSSYDVTKYNPIQGSVPSSDRTRRKLSSKQRSEDLRQI